MRERGREKEKEGETERDGKERGRKRDGKKVRHDNATQISFPRSALLGGKKKYTQL